MSNHCKSHQPIYFHYVHLGRVAMNMESCAVLGHKYLKLFNLNELPLYMVCLLINIPVPLPCVWMLCFLYSIILPS